ncbi:MAG: DUF1987 domain-containing protein [Bacteroidia bacterium]|jgi:hypothetical protein
MEAFIRNGTEDTPNMEFNPGSREFMISGRSLPENALSFYAPAIEWMKKYAAEPLPETEFKVSLEYFNSSSVKQLLTLFSVLEELHKSGKKASITWYYTEGDDLMEIKGQEFQSMVEVLFNLRAL